jgi:hypothetical protein
MAIQHDHALEVLQALVAVPGTLRIITNTHACGGAHTSTARFKHDGSPAIDDPTTAKEKATCDAFEFNMKHPNHFVIKDVVRIEGPNDKGQVAAFTADDVDYCVGQPAAVLNRTQEWQSA